VNVTLPKELEEFVLREVAQGQYPDANAVVADALLELRSKVADEGSPAWAQPLPDGTCPPDLKALLLEAVNGPHHPMPEDYFDRLRERLRISGAN
jgi:Arc/MetJ-type ribon-helix-helix transcriptional regulator